jgi:hypothetical protein
MDTWLAVKDMLHFSFWISCDTCWPVPFSFCVFFFWGGGGGEVGGEGVQGNGNGSYGTAVSTPKALPKANQTRLQDH